jgi:hypothetical protein
MKPKVLGRLLLLNAAVSVGVGLVLGMLVGGRMNMWAFAGLIAGLVWVASSLVSLLWYRFRREARWNYLEGLGWALLVYLLAVVPFVSSGWVQRRLSLHLCCWLHRLCRCYGSAWLMGLEVRHELR